MDIGAVLVLLALAMLALILFGVLPIIEEHLDRDDVGRQSKPKALPKNVGAGAAVPRGERAARGESAA